MKDQTKMSVGILGVGSYLPEQVRTNDWWPRSIVDEWEEKTILARKRLETPSPK